MIILASNPIIEAYNQSDLFGKAIFLALLGLSLLTWIVFLTKWRGNRKLQQEAVLIRHEFDMKKDHPLTHELVTSLNHPYKEVYQALKLQTVELLNKNRKLLKQDEKVTLTRDDLDVIEGSLYRVRAQYVTVMEKSLFMLSTVVSLAPFLGLLGTVWGILVTFTHLQAGAAGNSHAMVMNGLAMALGTTVVGLLVAIPALIGYNVLKSNIVLFANEIEDFSEQALIEVALHYRKGEA